MALGLLILRVTIGLTLAAHGAQKLFGWFGGPGLDGVARGMESLGFQPGRRHALMAGLVELGGGVLLALGLLTPLAAAVVGAVMIVAGVSAHLARGFFITNGGFEYTFVLGMAGLSLAFTGPGALSIDEAIGLSASGPLWGAAAMVVSLVGSGIALAGRRPAAVAQPA